MLAYIFWHRPYPNTERHRYEQAIVHFQNDLARSKPPGFIRRLTSFQISWRCPGWPTLPVHPRNGNCSMAPGPWTRSTRLPAPGYVQAPHSARRAVMMEQGQAGFTPMSVREHARTALHDPIG